MHIRREIQRPWLFDVPAEMIEQRMRCAAIYMTF